LNGLNEDVCGETIAFGSVVFASTVTFRNDQNLNDKGDGRMNRVGIPVTLQARLGNEIKAQEFQKLASPLVVAEVGITARFAFKLVPATFGIFHTSNNERGRSAHANGKVAKALFAHVEEMAKTTTTG
jgi:hypothetical protein